MTASLRHLAILLTLFAHAALAQTNAPGAPGKDSQWPSAGKQAVGTSNTLESKVWFTLQGGMLTEVFYPRVDTANVNMLQFVVVDPATKKVETERDDTIHEIKPIKNNSLRFQQINRAKSGKWKITKTYVTDPARNTVLVQVLFDTDDKNLGLYLYYDPSLNNSGRHDTAWNEDEVLLAGEKDIFSALRISPDASVSESEKDLPVPQISNGFFEVSDGIGDLRANGAMTATYQRAENGNVTQLMEIVTPRVRKTFDGTATGAYSQSFRIALSFGATVEEAKSSGLQSLSTPFADVAAEYDKGWADYVGRLPKVEAKYQNQFNMSAMVLKSFEDKTVRGGNVASLSTPWGGGNNGNETTTGYHLVWSRDLYQVATAFMAIGDRDSALRALNFLFKFQQREDGSFPQISWLDGRTVGDSIQMDEVSYPIILAYQLGRNDRLTYQNNIRKSAEYIVRNGPFTQQERWEEEAGYSPSTIAAQIAALVCAAEIARVNFDLTNARQWLAVADNWQKNVENWTATRNGPYGDGNYYLRLSQKGLPNSGQKLELGNGAGTHDERAIVDAGFLELVRLGIKAPNDPLIVKSLRVIDQKIRVSTPNGETFYRYNFDGYGDTYDGKRWNWDATWRGNGHPWPLLAGERGQYELALATFSSLGTKSKPVAPNALLMAKARSRLDAMLAFSNDGLMIPEQIWEKSVIPKSVDLGFIPPLKLGEGNGSATPLAWSMAQFIRLAMNLQKGRNLETPEVVYQRYVAKK